MYIRVHVNLSSRKELVTRIKTDSFEISVREEARGNQANNRVIMLIAKEYDVDRSLVRIVTGHHSKRKIIDVNI